MTNFTLLKWSSEFELGDTEIDNDHKGLISLYNELVSIVEAKEDYKEVIEVLTKLTNYSLQHFKKEEAWMQEISYPDFLIHQREHKDFIYRIAMFNLSYNSSDIKMAEEICSFLKQWISYHLIVSDKKIEDFSKER